jgi:hypothetical protein
MVEAIYYKSRLVVGVSEVESTPTQDKMGVRLR